MFEAFRKRGGIPEFLAKTDPEFREDDKPWFEKTEPVEPETEQVLIEVTYKARQERLQDLLDYLNGLDGRVVSAVELGEVLGITGGYAGLLVQDLIANKAITRKGKRGHYHYKVNRKSVNGRTASKPQSLAEATKVERKPRKKHLKEAILDYLSKNQSVNLSQEFIANELGTSPQVVQRHVVKLEKEGLIRRQMTAGHGTAYWVNGGSPIPDGETLPDDATREAILSLEEMIMDFVKETRDTDVLNFLNWVEYKQSKQE